jgi:hypothetical protein
MIMVGVWQLHRIEVESAKLYWGYEGEQFPEEMDSVKYEWHKRMAKNHAQAARLYELKFRKDSLDIKLDSIAATLENNNGEAAADTDTSVQERER